MKYIKSYKDVTGGETRIKRFREMGDASILSSIDKTHVLTFAQFTNAQQTGGYAKIIVLTYDLSKAKSQDYRRLKQHLLHVGFLKVDPSGKPLPMNTYILLVNNNILTQVMTTVNGYLNTIGKNFKVFACYTDSFLLNSKP